ncbi:MAG: hypothetical protein K8T89_07660 [Planctomycetes bacterium]|nr:hypothetical protein [Planctomycetota bacterium]
MDTLINAYFYNEEDGALTTIRGGRVISVDYPIARMGRRPSQPPPVNNANGFAPLVAPVMNFGGDLLTTNPASGSGNNAFGFAPLVAPSMNWESRVNTQGQIGGAYDPEPQPQVIPPAPVTPSYVGAAVPFEALVPPMMNFRP